MITGLILSFTSLWQNVVNIGRVNKEPFDNSAVPAYPDLVGVTRQVADELRSHWNIEVDVTRAIGRRYRRQDEIGTPYAVTVDFDTLDDQAVTVRDRDTMEQERVPIEGLVEHLSGRFSGLL